MNKIVYAIIATGTLILSLFYICMYRISDGAIQVSEPGICPKLIFDYPLQVTDKAYYIAKRVDEYCLYGQEGILVIPKYHQGSPYGAHRQINRRVTLGKPFIIHPNTKRTLGDVISEISPKALEADGLLFFVKGCPPVDKSVYFPAYVKDNKITHETCQFLGVYKLPAGQSECLNHIIWHELSGTSPIHIRDNGWSTTFEEAMQTGCFLKYHSICWPREYTDVEFKANPWLGDPTPGDYTVSLMVSWETSGDGATVQWSYTEADMSLIKEFLEINSQRDENYYLR